MKVKDCFRRDPAVCSWLVTDLGEVFRLGTAKAEENIAFRRHLSAHHHTDKPFQVLASEVQQQVDCTACANCCRHSIVSVNKGEIQGIAEYLRVAPEEVLHLYTVPDRKFGAGMRVPGRQSVHDLRCPSEGLPRFPTRYCRHTLAW